MFKINGENNFFDSVKDIIQDYSDGNIIPLEKCSKTIEAYNVEKVENNEYRKVAENFERYEKKNVAEESDDFYFYKYLKSLGKENEYSFPLKDGSKVVAKVNLFSPYEMIGEQKIVKPQWHLLVSNYAYLDAAYNHLENRVLEKTQWNCKQLIRDWEGRNKTISIWMQEAKKK